LLGLSLYDVINEGKNHGFVGEILLESKQLGLVMTYVSFVAIDGLTLLII